MFVFAWSEPGPLRDETGPDDWQTQVLRGIEAALAAGKTVDRAVRDAIRIAVRSGHGVGKTALVAWIILWFISCRSHPQIVVTANTKQQLEGKTWRELAKWHKLTIHRHWFRWTATKFYNVAHPETWFATSVPWSKERSEAFAGTHEENVLIIFDEGSGIEDIIWEVAEGAMTTPGAMWIVFGNPTRNTGRFRECWRKFKHRWLGFIVDSRTAKKANRTQIDEWIKDYGADSDFVRIRVLGQFPRVAYTQFIGEDLVLQSAARVPAPEEYEVAAKVFGLDIARFGNDQSVLVFRQGFKIQAVWKWRELDSHQLAFRVIEKIIEVQPDAVFAEEVGIGVGAIDIMRTNNHQIQGVIPQERAIDDRTYFNKRAEMWGEMKKWLRTGCCASLVVANENDPELDEELKDDMTGIEYGFDARGRIQMEKKEDMKARGQPSPDFGDALALTFYAPVGPREPANDQRDSWRSKLEANLGQRSWKVR